MKQKRTDKVRETMKAKKRFFLKVWLLRLKFFSKRILKAVIIYFIMAVIIMLLWNWLMTSLFGFRSIELWEALGLEILIKTLIHKPMVGN